MKCGFLKQIEARQALNKLKRETVVFQGRVLYLSRKAVKLWTPIGDIWIPYSEIPAEELATLKEGEQAQITIPRWLAREKGLVK